MTHKILFLLRVSYKVYLVHRSLVEAPVHAVAAGYQTQQQVLTSLLPPGSYSLVGYAVAVRSSA